MHRRPAPRAVPRRAVAVALALVLIALAVVAWRLRGRIAPAAPASPAVDAAPRPALRPGRLPQLEVRRPDAGATPTVVLRGRWGEGPGEFGRRRDPESAPEAPMALVAHAGDLWLLDQQNGRIKRTDRSGKDRGTLQIGSDTVQDLAVDPAGRLYTLDRVGESEVVVYSADGKPTGRIPVVGGPIEEGGAVTGIFADATGTYLEREHGEVVRVAGPDGTPDAKRPTQPGRPTRDGQRYLWARIADGRAGLATVRVFDHDGQLVWQRPVHFPQALVHLVLLDSDTRGHVYLGALVAERAADGTLAAPATVVCRLDLPSGAPSGTLVLPAYTGADEVFRELTVDDDGTVFQLFPGESGLEVRRFSFP